MDSLAELLLRLGRVIRARRERTGLSQEKFADKIHLHRTHMGQIERGKANVTIKALFQVTTGLDLTVPELFALATGDEGSLILPPEAARQRLLQIRKSQGKSHSKSRRRT